MRDRRRDVFLTCFEISRAIDSIRVTPNSEVAITGNQVTKSEKRVSRHGNGEKDADYEILSSRTQLPISQTQT